MAPQTRRRPRSSTVTIGSLTIRPLPKVTTRAPGSRRVSTTNPGTRRVCSAPTSRIASQAASGAARVVISLWMEAISVAPRPSAEEDGLDVVAVGVEDERSVVVLGVLRPDTRRPVVLAARIEGGAVEPRHRIPLLRLEGNVGRPTGGRRAVEPQRRLAARTEAGAAAVARAEHVAERRERRLVEPDAAIEILHLETDVVEQGTSAVEALN